MEGRDDGLVGRSVGTFIEGLTELRLAVYVFLAVWVVYLASAAYTGPLSVDVVSAFAPAWQVVTNGTLDLSDYAPALLEQLRGLSQAVEIDGALYSNRNPGVIAFALPFYLLAGVVTPDAYLPVWPQALAAATASAIAVSAVFLACRRVVPARTAVAAALVFAFATGTWSVSADAMWGHGPAQLFLALGVLAMSSDRNILAGLGYGAALTVRPYAGFASAVAGLHRSWAERSVRPALAIGVTTALGLAAFMLYTRTIFGVWSVYGGYTGRDYLATNVGGGQGLFDLPTDVLWALVHPEQGLLVYAPFLVVLVVALPAGWRAAPAWVRSAFLGGCAFFLAQLYANTWDAGEVFFGYRYPLEFLTMAAPMGAIAYQQGVRGRPLRVRLFRYLVAVALGLQFAGAVLDLSKP